MRDDHQDLDDESCLTILDHLSHSQPCRPGITRSRRYDICIQLVGEDRRGEFRIIHNTDTWRVNVGIVP